MANSAPATRQAVHLRRIGVAVRGRLGKAQDARQLPVSPLKNKKYQVTYETFVTLDRREGEIRVNVVVEGLGWTVPEAADPGRAAEWMETGGADLLATIDRIVARDDLGVTGATRLVLPVLVTEGAP